MFSFCHFFPANQFEIFIGKPDESVGPSSTSDCALLGLGDPFAR
jgi:hypothetical protein